MNLGKLVFAQLTQHLPLTTFRRCVARYGGEHTRALSLVGTGEAVVRDMFYDGNARPEQGAIVCRVAPSFLRFGNFQLLAAHQELDALKRLVEYVMREHFPAQFSGAAAYADWFGEICHRTGMLMADWMRLGFVHGVMNTDNLSILGLTIDYGPYGWLEGYDLDWTPNTTDAEGRRYCYGNQPQIAQWNLTRLAEALLPLIPDQEALKAGLTRYAESFAAAWQGALAQKLGLASLDQTGDDTLVEELFQGLAEQETDFTIFFRNLAAVPLDGQGAALLQPLLPAFYSGTSADLAATATERMISWLQRYCARTKSEGGDAPARHRRMQAANPKYIFRNYLAQQAIKALEQGDASLPGVPNGPVTKRAVRRFPAVHDGYGPLAGSSLVVCPHSKSWRDKPSVSLSLATNFH